MIVRMLYFILLSSSNRKYESLYIGYETMISAICLAMFVPIELDTDVFGVKHNVRQHATLNMYFRTNVRIASVLTP